MKFNSAALFWVEAEMSETDISIPGKIKPELCALGDSSGAKREKKGFLVVCGLDKL